MQLGQHSQPHTAPAEADTHSDAVVALHRSKMDANADGDADDDVDAGARVDSNAVLAPATTVATTAAVADAFPGQVAAPSRCKLVKFVATF